MTMGRPDYIFGQLRETARCHDAQHGAGLVVHAPRRSKLASYGTAVDYTPYWFMVSQRCMTGNFKVTWHTRNWVRYLKKNPARTNLESKNQYSHLLTPILNGVGNRLRSPERNKISSNGKRCCKRRSLLRMRS